MIKQTCAIFILAVSTTCGAGAQTPNRDWNAPQHTADFSASLESAVSSVATRLGMVERAYQHCSRTFPAATNDAKKALDGWKSRNASYLAIHARVLKEYFTQNEREYLMDKVSVELARFDKKLGRAGEPGSKELCALYVDELGSTKKDFATTPDAGGPLREYAAGKR